MPSKYTKSHRKKILLASASLAAALAIAEISLRTIANHDTGHAIVLGVRLPPFHPSAEYVATNIALLANANSLGSYISDSPTLGWTIAPNGREALAESNAQGARTASNQPYEQRPRPGITRILTFGDSFTHGDEVPTQDTWQAQMEAERPTIEVVNFGVSGYGTDQAYLRAREKMPLLTSHRAWLCIWPEDLSRNLNIYRFLLTGGNCYLTKPRLRLDPTGSLEVCSSHIRSRAELLKDLFIAPPDSAALELEEWYHPNDFADNWWHISYACRFTAGLMRKRSVSNGVAQITRGANATANELAVAICDSFAKLAMQHNSVPTIIIIPQRDFLQEFPGTGDSKLPIVATLNQRNIETIDLSTSFANVDPKMAFLPSGHLAREGNAIIARALLHTIE